MLFKVSLALNNTPTYKMHSYYRCSMLVSQTTKDLCFDIKNQHFYYVTSLYREYIFWDL